MLPNQRKRIFVVEIENGCLEKSERIAESNSASRFAALLFDKIYFGHIMFVNKF